MGAGYYTNFQFRTTLVPYTGTTQQVCMIYGKVNAEYKDPQLQKGFSLINP